jgi:hypothetical protein
MRELIAMHKTAAGERRAKALKKEAQDLIVSTLNPIVLCIKTSNGID